MKNSSADPGQQIERIRSGLYDERESLDEWELEALRLVDQVKATAGGAEPAKAALSVHLARVLERAVDRLVASSNNNTETMARLQERVVDLTGTYVRLQGWVVGLTVAAVVAAFFSVAAASIQAYRALYPVPTQILAQPLPARAAAPSPTPVRDAASQPAPASAAKNPR
jgi:hypothetical protein